MKTKEARPWEEIPPKRLTMRARPAEPLIFDRGLLLIQPLISL
jgi:hypothetical protein